jgi:hypothetical protein
MSISEKPLITLAEGYITADGYSVTLRGRDLLFGTKRGLADTQLIYVFVPDARALSSFQSLEGPYLNRFKEVSDLHPQAQKVLLVPSLEGVSTEFRRDANRSYGVKIRVPVQFLDTAFKWEEDEHAPSAAREQRDEGKKILHARASQPYRLSGSNIGPEDDLLDRLTAELLDRSNPRGVHVIVGPAGFGKSHLFKALFARLHERFLIEKNRHALASRPLPTIPEYLPLADSASSVKSLLRAYLTTDLARPLDVNTFEWLVGHGMVTWMIDGLDEVIEQDRQFFGYLTDLILDSEPGVPPRIVLCIRDSILATNPEFREFRDECSAWTHVYHVQPWGHRSKEQYARLHLTARADDFVRFVEARPGLSELASNAYYCSLLATHYELGELRTEYSERVLVEEAIEDIIRRDYRKEILDKVIVTREVIRDFAEAMAADDFEAGFRGVPAQSASELADLSLPGSLLPADRERYRNQLTAMAFYAFGGLGQIRFAQEILEHYFIGCWLAKLFEQRPEAVASKLALRTLPADSLILRVLADAATSPDGLLRLKELALLAGDRPHAFKNLLQIASIANTNSTSLRDLVFERKDLAGLTLTGVDLDGISLRGCDLTDTTFRDCSLRGTNLEGALIRNTRFLGGADSLSGVHFGSLERFYSVAVGEGRTFNSPATFRAWLDRAAGRTTTTEEPCPTTLQVRQMFAKFIWPTGQPRRDWQGSKAMLSGTKYVDRPDEVLTSLVQYGYLSSADDRRRYHRTTDDDAYREMRRFVMAMTITPTLRRLLDDMCPRLGCRHIAAAQAVAQ